MWSYIKSLKSCIFSLNFKYAGVGFRCPNWLIRFNLINEKINEQFFRILKLFKLLLKKKFFFSVKTLPP